MGRYSKKADGKVGPATGAPSRELINQSRSLNLPKRDYEPKVKSGRNK